MTSCSIFVVTVVACFVILGLIFAFASLAKPKGRPTVPGDDPFRPYRTDLAPRSAVTPPHQPPQFRVGLVFSEEPSYPAPPSNPSGPRWLSARSYGYKVRGTSHYQDALEAVCGGRTDESVERQEPATLILETANPFDRNAVRIEIQGRHVGYLSRDDAKAFRERVARERLPGDRFPCPALILGGWDRDGDRGRFGLRLALAL